MKYRASGVLCHITSLPSPFGIGDLGPGAYAFADFLIESRQGYWQTLPINPTNEDHASSPFSSKSAFAGNVLLISPQLLVEQGLLSPSDLRPIGSEDTADFKAAAAFKLDLFARAFSAFSRHPKKAPEYAAFCEENAHWLEDYALFAALGKKYPKKTLSQWPGSLKSRDPNALAEIREAEKEAIDQEKFLQYLFFRQWFQLKKYCNRKGIQLIGDFPFFMDGNSADVWAHPGAFKVDAKLEPYAVAGCPPDDYAPKGQLFNCTVYDWDRLKETGFTWWIDRMLHMFKTFDIVRIDHFRGWVAHWEVPVGAPTAESGKWQPGKYFEFVNTLLKFTPVLPIFAEDLGQITPDIRQAMEKYSIPGIKMILYAFAKEQRADEFLPHNHIPHCVVYVGTHDTDTVNGWFSMVNRQEDRELLFKYLGREIKTDANWEMIRMAMASVANTAILQLQDILGLGAEARMNNPVGKGNNWCWRFRTEQLSGEVRNRLREMTTLYGRS